MNAPIESLLLKKAFTFDQIEKQARTTRRRHQQEKVLKKAMSAYSTPSKAEPCPGVKRLGCMLKGTEIVRFCTMRI